MTAESYVSDMFAGELEVCDATGSADKGRRIATAATRLAIAFSDDTDLPARYQKSSSGKSRKVTPEARVEKRFRANVHDWRRALETMLAKLDADQAWRFIELCPSADKPISKVTESKDFCDFCDYFALRRDQEMCGPEELGCLAMLLSAFQRETEKRLKAGDRSLLPLAQL